MQKEEPNSPLLKPQEHVAKRIATFAPGSSPKDVDNNNISVRHRSKTTVKSLSTLKLPLQSKPTITTENFDDPTPPDVFLTKWVDYSAKYGIGFMLSEGSSGVHFNDSSKIVAEPNSRSFAMIQREKAKVSKHDVQVVHSFDNCPEELKKKIDLFNHFTKYL